MDVIIDPLDNHTSWHMILTQTTMIYLVVLTGNSRNFPALCSEDKVGRAQNIFSCITQHQYPLGINSSFTVEDWWSCNTKSRVLGHWDAKRTLFVIGLEQITYIRSYKLFYHFLLWLQRWDEKHSRPDTRHDRRVQSIIAQKTISCSRRFGERERWCWSFHGWV